MFEVDLSLGPEMLQTGFFLLSHLSSGVIEPWLHQSGDVPPHGEGFLYSAISLFLQKIIKYLLIFLSILLALNLRPPRQRKTGQPEDWPVFLRVPLGLNNLVKLGKLPPATWPRHCLGPRQAVIAQFPLETGVSTTQQHALVGLLFYIQYWLQGPSLLSRWVYLRLLALITQGGPV